MSAKTPAPEDDRDEAREWRRIRGESGDARRRLERVRRRRDVPPPPAPDPWEWPIATRVGCVLPSALAVGLVAVGASRAVGLGVMAATLRGVGFTLFVAGGFWLFFQGFRLAMLDLPFLLTRDGRRPWWTVPVLYYLAVWEAVPAAGRVALWGLLFTLGGLVLGVLAGPEP